MTYIFLSFVCIGDIRITSTYIVRRTRDDFKEKRRFSCGLELEMIQ